MRRRTWTGRALAGLTGTLVCFAGSRQIGAITAALCRTAGRPKKRLP